MIPRNTRLTRIVPPMLAAFLAACASPSQSRVPYPPDSILEERFRSLEADFNRLAGMLREDKGLMSVGDEGAWSDDGVKADIPQQRLDEYRALFKKLGVKYIGRHKESGHIVLPVWFREGKYADGAAKYYVFSEAEPEPLTDSLDRAFNSGHDVYGYKRIGGEWYLHLTVG